jgi:hypothetical protein
MLPAPEGPPSTDIGSEKVTAASAAGLSSLPPGGTGLPATVAPVTEGGIVSGAPATRRAKTSPEKPSCRSYQATRNWLSPVAATAGKTCSAGSVAFTRCSMPVGVPSAPKWRANTSALEPG